MKVDKKELLDGDVFYFPGDPMYVYEVSGEFTYVFGDDTPLPLSMTRGDTDEVIVIHNSYEKRAEFRG